MWSSGNSQISLWLIITDEDEGTCEGAVSAFRNTDTITLEPDTGLRVYNISAGQHSVMCNVTMSRLECRSWPPAPGLSSGHKASSALVSPAWPQLSQPRVTIWQMHTTIWGLTQVRIIILHHPKMQISVNFKVSQISTVGKKSKHLKILPMFFYSPTVVSAWKEIKVKLHKQAQTMIKSRYNTKSERIVNGTSAFCLVLTLFVGVGCLCSYSL